MFVAHAPIGFLEVRAFSRSDLAGLRWVLRAGRGQSRIRIRLCERKRQAGDSSLGRGLVYELRPPADRF